MPFRYETRSGLLDPPRDGDDRDRFSLPPWLQRLSTIGTVGFGLAVLLWGLSFLTNPAPAPYYPWLESPVRLPITQPRIGHYPASWTLGIWLWEITFPFVLLRIYERRGGGPTRLRRWLIAVPAAYMLAFFGYCRWIWPKPADPWLFEPATNILCWAYCVTYADFWAVTTAAVGLLGIVAWVAARSERRGVGWLSIAFGVLSVPLGVPAIYAGYVHVQRRT